MNLNHYYNLQKLADSSSQIKKIFFYRVCGTGMGACATLLKEQGLHIEGGDTRFAPPMSDYLRETGIQLHDLTTMNSEYLKSFDLIVVGNVVPKDSEDAKIIEESGVPFASFPATLGALVLNNINVIGIAGTHGKTTTTYLATQIFEKLGFHPGYFVGGVIKGRASSCLGDGRYFFIESDEYDSGYFEKFSKFRSYCLNHMILTSLEFDHGDIFNDISDIQKQFTPVLETLNGSLIYDETYQHAKDCIGQLTKTSFRRLQPYGQGMTNGPEIIEMGKEGTTFRLFYNGELKVFKTNLVGRHNILNLSACLLFCDHEKIPYEKIGNAIQNLELVKRRQEVKGYIGEALVIDDFAHHPRAMDLTIDGIRYQYPDKNIVVVFEPNSATARSNLFQEEFTQALKKSAHVIVTKPVRDTSLKQAKNLDLALIKADLEQFQIGVDIVSNLDELMQALIPYQGPQNLLLVLSNGTCLGLWESEFVRT